VTIDAALTAAIADAADNEFRTKSQLIGPIVENWLIRHNHRTNERAVESQARRDLRPYISPYSLGSSDGPTRLERASMSSFTAKPDVGLFLWPRWVSTQALSF